MERNLKDFKKDGKDVFNDQLQKRLRSQQDELKKNEKVLEEIEKVISKINKEDLTFNAAIVPSPVLTKSRQMM